MVFSQIIEGRANFGQTAPLPGIRMGSVIILNKEYQLPNMGGNTLAKRLTVQLIQELRSGIYATAARLPSEVELAEQLGVSRSVIRDMLADLEREGYVERGRGVGTMINRQIVKLNNRLDLKLEYYDLIRGAGAVPSTDSVRLYQKNAEGNVAERLQVDEGEPLVVCEKRVFASGKPVIYSIDHLPLALFADSNWKLYDWSAPVFDLLEKHCGIVVDSSICQLTAVNGSPPIRERLEVEENEALILLEEVGYYKLNRPILHSYGFYTNYFEFALLRKKF